MVVGVVVWEEEDPGVGVGAGSKGVKIDIW